MVTKFNYQRTPMERIMVYYYDIHNNITYVSIIFLRVCVIVINIIGIVCDRVIGSDR